MTEIDLRRIKAGELVLRFGGAAGRIDARALALSLESLADALEEITAQIAPSARIEILVVALESGSFRVKIKTLFGDTGKLFKGWPTAIVTGVLSTIIYESYIRRHIHPEMPINVTVSDSMVVIQRGADRVVVPRITWDATSSLPRREEVDRSVSGMFDGLRRDPNISDFGLLESASDPDPIGVIPQAAFANIASRERAPEDGPRRHRDERVKVIVVKAIFEVSARKWEFIWGGHKISAPITDPSFYRRMASRQYVFGQGDLLDVTLRVHQRWDEIAQTYVNTHYEIKRVHDVVRAPKQGDFEDG